MKERLSRITNANYKNIIYIYFALTFVFILSYLISYKNKCLSSITSDWLINYQDGGFKRRGASGTFVFFISDLFNIDVRTIVFILQLLTYIIFFIFLVKLIPKKVNIGLFVILLSPLSLGLNIIDPNIIGRKEILLFAIFSYCNYLLINRKLYGFYEFSVLLLLSIITLFHELTIFYVPYFFVVLYLYEKKVNIRKYIIYCLAVLIPAFLLFFFGSKINNGKSISILKSKGIICDQIGIFGWNESANILDIYRAKIDSYSLYIIPLIIGFLLVNLYFKYSKINYKWNVVLIFLLLYSFPLFYLAIDWGRWINIHFTLITIIVIAFYSQKKVIFPSYFIYLIPLMLIWGFDHFERGFHFNTYLNYLVLKKILHFNYSFY